MSFLVNMFESPSTSRKIFFANEMPATLESTVNLTTDLNLTEGAESPGVERTVNVTTDMNLTEAGDSRYDQPMFFTPSQISTPIMKSTSIDNIYSEFYFRIKKHIYFFFLIKI